MATLCNEQFDSKINKRIIVIFSNNNPGKGNAILHLIKQFGIFPIELFNRQGEFDFDEFSQLSKFDGLTVIIQAFYKNDYISTNDKTNNEQSNIHSLIPSFENIEDNNQNYLNDFMKSELTQVNNLLFNGNDIFSNKVVYLASFDDTKKELMTTQFPETIFLPWYLCVGNTTNRIFRQPELNTYFTHLHESKPLIDNLESMIMHST